MGAKSIQLHSVSISLIKSCLGISEAHQGNGILTFDNGDVYYYLGDILCLWSSLLIHYPCFVENLECNYELFGMLSRLSLRFLTLGSENLVLVFSIVNSYILMLPISYLSVP